MFSISVILKVNNGQRLIINKSPGHNKIENNENTIILGIN